MDLCWGIRLINMRRSKSSNQGVYKDEWSTSARGGKVRKCPARFPMTPASSRKCQKVWLYRLVSSAEQKCVCINRMRWSVVGRGRERMLPLALSFPGSQCCAEAWEEKGPCLLLLVQPFCLQLIEHRWCTHSGGLSLPSRCCGPEGRSPTVM